MKGYPKWFSVSFVTSVVLILFLTGLLLLPTTLELRGNLDSVPWRLESSNRTIVVAGHALFGFLMVAVLGALWTTHMRVGWRSKLKRPSGSLLVSFNLILVLTGIGIYYLGDDFLSSVASLSHAGIGLLLMPFYFFHMLYVRPIRR